MIWHHNIRLSNQYWNNVEIYNMEQCWINVVYFNVYITTLGNFETMLLFSILSFWTLINVETTLWIWSFSKSWEEQKKCVWGSKKDFIWLATIAFNCDQLNLFQCWYNNIRQFWNNVIIFDVEFHNVDQCWNNIVNMIIF